MGKKSKDEKRVKKDKKEKKIKKSKSETVAVDQEAVQLYLSPVASPMAEEDLCKQLLKLTSKGLLSLSSLSLSLTLSVTDSVSLCLARLLSLALCLFEILATDVVTATKEKNVRRGVKEVVKALRKQQQGYALPLPFLPLVA